MPKRTAPMFEAEFVCAGKTTAGCGSVITVRTYLAVVQGHGTEVSCVACRAHYVVTEDGAQMIGDDTPDGVYPSPPGQFRIDEPVPPWDPYWEEPK